MKQGKNLEMEITYWKSQGNLSVQKCGNHALNTCMVGKGSVGHVTKVFITLHSLVNSPLYKGWLTHYPSLFSPPSCTREVKSVSQTCKSILPKLLLSHPVIG